MPQYGHLPSPVVTTSMKTRGCVLHSAIELVEDKATKKPYGADQKVGARVIQEMSKRGVITRARLEHIFYSPAIVITEAELDRMVSVTQEAVKAVTGK